MLKIKRLFPNHFSSCYDWLDIKSRDLDYLKKLGWSINQSKSQLSKKINFGLGLFKGSILADFVIGNLITIEKKSEYEILLIYVSSQIRKLGHETKLFANIPLILKKDQLKKIYIEVSADNFKAIKLYKKNRYKKTRTRNNYYVFENKKIDAYYFEKIINDKR